MKSITATLCAYEKVLPYKRVEFRTYDSTILRGNLYHASTIGVQVPIVVLTHGLGLTKEQYLENWFRHFIDSGYHVLVYDNRSFGDSDGMPRNNFNWSQQAEDFIDAVTYVESLPEVDDTKVFGWGVAHSGGTVAMAAAKDKRIAGIIMFLPCMDRTWDRSRWGEEIYDRVKQHRYKNEIADGESVPFWPLTDEQALGTGDSVLSGDYVRKWSTVAKRMAEQGGNHFNGAVTVAGIWNDFTTRLSDCLDLIVCPVLWIMATEDVVCGPLDFTNDLYDRIVTAKEKCILEGQHLAQYFDPGFPIRVEAMLAFLKKYV